MVLVVAGFGLLVGAQVGAARAITTVPTAGAVKVHLTAGSHEIWGDISGPGCGYEHVTGPTGPIRLANGPSDDSGLSSWEAMGLVAWGPIVPCSTFWAPRDGEYVVSDRGLTADLAYGDQPITIPPSPTPYFALSTVGIGLAIFGVLTGAVTLTMQGRRRRSTIGWYPAPANSAVEWFWSGRSWSAWRWKSS